MCLDLLKSKLITHNLLNVHLSVDFTTSRFRLPMTKNFVDKNLNKDKKLTSAIRSEPL
jgi:hypothetical protein